MGDYGIGYTKDNQEFFFDLEDYSIIKNYTWYVSNGYIVASVWNTQKKCSKRMTMHRLILETCLNKNIINDIDHKNRKRYDNRKENLRICTHKDNLKNSSIRSNNTSGLIGVVYDRNREKWMARIVLNKKDTSKIKSILDKYYHSSKITNIILDIYYTIVEFKKI